MPQHGPGTFHAGLYDALYNLDPDTLDGRAKVSEVKLHAIVDDLDTARIAVEGGASVIIQAQGRSDGGAHRPGRALPTPEREYVVTFVVNDDVQAALALLADGVHLGQDDEGSELAVEAGMM